MTRKGLIKGSRRIEIISRNFGICVYCNEAPAEQIDHILPRSWKVYNDDDNLVGTCIDCNHIASDKVFESFEAKQAYIVRELKKPKWKNRRVASYTFMPRILQKLKPPKKAKKQIQQTPKAKVVPLTEKELLLVRKKLNTVLRHLSVGGKVHAYEQLAKQLSTLAGLTNGHTWSWRYVVSVKAGTMYPSRKFTRALDLLLLNMSPRQRQWFYFANRRRDVAAVYNKSILREMIFTHMKAMGYKPVTFTRYAEIKRRRTA